MTRLSEDYDKWIDSLLKRDLSHSTLREYKRDVKQFLDWLHANGGAYGDARSIGMVAARQYREELIQNHKPSTINRRIQSVASFLSYLNVPDKENPFKNLKHIQIVRHAPKSIDRNSWNRLSYVAEDSSHKDHGLALAAVSLMRHAGLRVGELVALRLSDIEIKEKSGRVLIRNGKGFKSRVVPLNLDARDALGSWLESRDDVLKRAKEKFEEKGIPIPDWVNSDFIFIGQKGVLTTRGINHITNKLGDLAKIEDGLSPHKLRHTFARAALDPKGYMLNRDPVPLPALKKMLGHSRIETTSIYTEFEEDDHARFLEEKLSE
jgi:site-specific recombinase XerD